MTTHSLLLLPGDGIGPEVMAEVERIVAFFNKKGKAQFKTETALCGGASIDKHGVPLTSEALAKAEAADAIVFGAGGPRDKVATRSGRSGCSGAQGADLFANLRPAICYAAPPRPPSARARRGPDILILRELTGGTISASPRR
jgi:3-isopropylmalate dehydrogenase